MGSPPRKHRRTSRCAWPSRAGRSPDRDRGVSCQRQRSLMPVTQRSLMSGTQKNHVHVRDRGVSSRAHPAERSRAETLTSSVNPSPWCSLLFALADFDSLDFVALPVAPAMLPVAVPSGYAGVPARTCSGVMIPHTYTYMHTTNTCIHMHAVLRDASGVLRAPHRAVAAPTATPVSHSGASCQ